MTSTNRTRGMSVEFPAPADRWSTRGTAEEGLSLACSVERSTTRLSIGQGPVESGSGNVRDDTHESLGWLPGPLGALRALGPMRGQPAQDSHDDAHSGPMAAELSVLLAEFARSCKGAARAVSLYPGTHPAIGISL